VVGRPVHIPHGHAVRGCLLPHLDHVLHIPDLQGASGAANTCGSVSQVPAVTTLSRALQARQLTTTRHEHRLQCVYILRTADNSCPMHKAVCAHGAAAMVADNRWCVVCMLKHPPGCCCRPLLLPAWGPWGAATPTTAAAAPRATARPHAAPRQTRHQSTYTASVRTIMCQSAATEIVARTMLRYNSCMRQLTHDYVLGCLAFHAACSTSWPRHT
jgi:hypothetical protein